MQAGRGLPKPSAELTALTGEVIGAAIEVHRILGPGHLEGVYERALCVELRDRGIPFEEQASLSVRYKGRVVGEGRVDLVVANRLIVELKAVEQLMGVHSAQVLSYLKASGLELGLLINFNEAVLKNGIKRIINTPRN